MVVEPRLRRASHGAAAIQAAYRGTGGGWSYRSVGRRDSGCLSRVCRIESVNTDPHLQVLPNTRAHSIPQHVNTGYQPSTSTCHTDGSGARESLPCTSCTQAQQRSETGIAFAEQYAAYRER